MKIETLAVHAGRRIDPPTGAVAQPIHMSTTFERGADGKWPRGYSYSREENPNRDTLEQCIGALEGGNHAFIYSSGLAVVTAVMNAMQPGDHLIFPDDVYYGLRRVVNDVYAHWNLETDFIDLTDLDTLKAAVKPNTRLIWMETPSNPMLKILDMASIARIAREANAISVCDSTFATPVLQRPLELGVDLVMHSTTKFISGHSDVVGGALISKYESYVLERACKFQKYGGAVPSPFDCWLTRRGLDTLPLRVRQHSSNAMQLAEFLQAHPAVEQVNYPGLPSHPRHDLARSQMTGGFGGMLSFHVRGGRPEAMGVAARVKLITRATSLGGTHSLIEHRRSTEGPKSTTPQNLLRISAGIENVDDLIADLDQALSVLR